MLNVIIFVMGVVSLILQFVSDTVPGSEFLAMDEVTIVSRLIGMICISLPLYLIVLFIPEGFGGGDIKLMAVIGFFLGWKMSLTAFMLAVFSGGIYGIGLLFSKKKGAKEHFAFGPFLCAGTALTLFVGERLLSWYLSIIF